MRDKHIRKLYRPSWAAYIALWSHLIWVVFLVFVVLFGPFGDKSPYLQPNNRLAGSVYQSVATSSGMTAIDFAGLGLTVLGVVLGIAAFGGFFVFRAAAQNAAREEATLETQRILPGLMTAEFMEEVLQKRPDVVLRAFRQARGLGMAPDEISDEFANEIARELEDEANNNAS